MEGRRSRTLGSDVPRVPGTGELGTEDSDTDEVEMTLQVLQEFWAIVLPNRVTPGNVTLRMETR